MSRTLETHFFMSQGSFLVQRGDRRLVPKIASFRQVGAVIVSQARKLRPRTSPSAHPVTNQTASLNRYAFEGKPIGMSACRSCCQRTKHACAFLSCSCVERDALPHPSSCFCYQECTFAVHCCCLNHHHHFMLTAVREGIRCVRTSSRVIDCYISKVLVPRARPETP